MSLKAYLDTWKPFLGELKHWRKMYIFYSWASKAGKIIALIALIDHIRRGTKNLTEACQGDKNRLKILKEIFDEMHEYYNPDTDFEKLQNTLLCMDLNVNSYLIPKWGGKICGKYLGMDDEPGFTKLMNIETGLFEEEECHTMINIAYPNATDILKIPFLDIEKMDSFQE